MSHDNLVSAAEEALDNIHSDTSVTPVETMRSLVSLQEHLSTLIDAVQSDIDRQEDMLKDTEDSDHDEDDGSDGDG